MKFGIQVTCYLTTWDDIRSVVEYYGGRTLAQRVPRRPLHPSQQAQLNGIGDRVRGLLDDGGGGVDHQQASAGAPGARKHLPQSGTRRQDGRDYRPHLAWTVHAVHRRRLVPARARGVRLVLPIAQGAFRPSGGGREPHQAALYVRLTRQLQGAILHPRQRCACLPARHRVRTSQS